ncbi:hypothetical protein, partial [Zymomonas mobilis]|uniref:hypothetical protein n=1 Tax=Zymomonas mobilis TaxID=542 RepID=UPI0039ED9476
MSAEPKSVTIANFLVNLPEIESKVSLINDKSLGTKSWLNKSASLERASTNLPILSTPYTMCVDEKVSAAL